MSGQTTVSMQALDEHLRKKEDERMAAAHALGESHNRRIAAEEEADRRRRELEDELAETMRDLVKDNREKYRAAVKLGWSEQDLNGLGLELPGQPKRNARRASSRSKRTTAASAQHSTEPSAQRGGENIPQTS